MSLFTMKVSPITVLRIWPDQNTMESLFLLLCMHCVNSCSQGIHQIIEHWVIINLLGVSA